MTTATRDSLVGDVRVRVFQVCFDAASQQHVDPMFTPYLNHETSPFMESAVIARLLEAQAHAGADYFGVVSWRIADKIPLPPEAWMARMAADRFRADAYAFFGRLGSGPVWPLAERKHPGIMRAAALLLQRLDIDVDVRRLTAPLVYQNHMLCRAAVYERFGRELLSPALAAMGDPADPLLQALVRQDAGYGSSLGPERLRAIFGVPYFTLQPFIAERLFSTWLALNPAVTLRHIWRGRFVETAHLAHEPEMQPRVRRRPQ